MNILNESSTFTVPLSFEAHSLAEQFRRQQSSPQKAKQVYLNTLAVYAVDFYLRCLGIETEVDKSDSRNPLYLKFMNVADLWVKSIGRLECCPVLPGSTVMQIPVEAREDRIGYVAAEIERSLKQATLIGFTPTAAAEISLNQLKSLAEFPEYLHQLRQPSRTWVNLGQWLDNRIEENRIGLEELTTSFGWLDNQIKEGWQNLEALFTPEKLTPVFRTRSTSIERGKLIRLATEVMQQTIVLVVKLNPESEKDTNITVEICPQSGQLYLPETLQVRVLNEQRKAEMEAIASSTNQNIQFNFDIVSGERFSVQMMWEGIIVTEEFVI